MKKLILLTCLTLISVIGSAQVICYVEAPSPNEGSKDITYTTPGGGWGSPDLTNPANAITANVEFVTDGVDSLSCGPLTNDLTGKIAVLYRGSCEFGTKALNAENAGAIGVIIINVAGEPVGMGPGADGGSITIPVVMISNVDGGILKAEFEAGTTTVFIGTKVGLYADDIGFTQSDYLRAESFGVISKLNVDDTEFDVTIGSWVRNYGTNDQFDITLQCTIFEGGSPIYDQTSAPQTILAGDSMFIPLPLFTQTSYPNGLYEMDYMVAMGAADEASFDNQQEANFMVNDSLYSLSRIDDVTFKPIQTVPQFNGSTSLMETCLHFRDPNASRMFIKGVSFAGNTSQFPTTTSLDGNFFEVYAYEWNDVFTDFNDYPDLTVADLNEIAYGSYIYTSDIQGVPVWVPFDNNEVLIDNQRYLFCMTFDPNIYPGYDNKVDYTRNFEADLQPYNVLRLDAAGNYFFIGFGSDQSPTLTINMQDTAYLSIVQQPIEDLELDAYPNPTPDFLNIPLNGYEGDVQMKIFNLEGKLVEIQQVGMKGNTLTVDVTSIPAGTYVMDLDFDNGEKATVRFAVVH
jgi:hypothetical protein